MRIDAHHHLWDPARGDYGWLAPGSALDRSFAPDDLAPLIEEAGIGATILVQAAPTEAETDWLLRQADRVPWIAGVVGWTDLAAPDAPARVATLADRRWLVGLRPMLQDLPRRDWILSDAQPRALAAMAEAGLVFDALVRADGIGTVASLADRYPALPIVLDHAGKPPFADGAALARWQDDLSRLAERPGVWCKLSGLLTELPAGGGPDPVADAVAPLLDRFGAERLIWGSDWPVLTLAGSYDGWFALARSLVPPAHHAAVFGGNAARLYLRRQT